MSDQRPQDEIDLERVRKCCESLAEHFDSVQILCTRNTGEKDGNTVNVSMGRGNWFARYGQIREWLTKQEEGARWQARKDADSDQ